VIGGGLEAIVAVSMLRQPEIVASRSCLGIGQNVCLSGSTEWVAAAAAAAPRQQGTMFAMAGDDAN
jgi:hypothetical protein